jgi:phosphoribosylformylglycinamidine synthase
MKYTANVFVTLKEGVLDPQGGAVVNSLHTLGYSEVEEVRVGKYMILDLEADDIETAKVRVDEMCNRLLANTVIEDYKYEIKEVE